MSSTAADFHGIFPYLVSPVDDSTGTVREGVLNALIEHLISSGVHGISPLGSTGEIVYLTAAQRVAIVRATMAAVGGRVPVVPGISAYSTTDALHQAEALLKLDVDGLILMLQTQFPVSPSGVERYFRTVAEAVKVPIVLYTNPGLGGADLTPEIVEALSDVPNIRYVKDASGRTGRILAIINRVGERIKVFSASAHIPTVVFQLGGVGWMAGPACVIPRESVALYELAHEGRWDEAYALQRPLWRLNELFEKYSLAACIKTALQLQGFDVGGPIAPQEPLGAVAVEEIRAGLASLENVGKQ